MDRFNAVVLRRLQEDEKQPELHAKWTQARAQAQAQAAAAKAQAEATKPAGEGGKAQPEIQHPHETALTVTEQRKASGFGLNLDETMPLLTETVSRILGESETAQCVREMKALDPGFRISALQDEMERIVAPKFIEWFLAGEREKLKAHLGEAAFAAVNSSLQARLKAGAEPDQRILYGPREVELRLAIPSEEAGGDAGPCFVFQFVTQQVNCFRNKKTGEVVEGAADDIRELNYVVAITRNLKAEGAEGSDLLEHPWLIKELAIVGNRRTW
jgi:hypothetical protein